MTRGNRRRRVGCGAVMALVMALGAPGLTGQDGGPPLVSRAQYDAWFDELSNWGRWGPDDEMGALNLITPEKRREARLALHDFALTMLGVHLMDRSDFDDLAAAAAERNRWEFMLTIAPLPIPRGTGSPVNPIAVF